VRPGDLGGDDERRRDHGQVLDQRQELAEGERGGAGVDRDGRAGADPSRGCAGDGLLRRGVGGRPGQERRLEGEGGALHQADRAPGAPYHPSGLELLGVAADGQSTHPGEVREVAHGREAAEASRELDDRLPPLLRPHARSMSLIVQS
jgi:hypothetical protein